MYKFDLLLQKDLGDVMEEIDTDKSGGIDFEEFLNFMTTDRSSSRKNSDATEYSEIFDFIDDDKNGFISAEDLKKVRIILLREAVVFLHLLLSLHTSRTVGRVLRERIFEACELVVSFLSGYRQTWTETFKPTHR